MSESGRSMRLFPDSEASFMEFNHCHAPSDGKFCSAPDKGGGGGTSQAARVFRVIVPFDRDGKRKQVSYPSSGHSLYTGPEAAKVLAKFAAKGGEGHQPGGPLEPWAESESYRFTLDFDPEGVGREDAATEPAAPSAPAAKTRWKIGSATVQAGDYAESNTEVKQHVSEDGRFTITPTGSTNYRREFGVRGPNLRKFRWSGYQLVDNHPGLPDYVRKIEKHHTVGSAKKAADRRRLKHP